MHSFLSFYKIAIVFHTPSDRIRLAWHSAKSLPLTGRLVVVAHAKDSGARPDAEFHLSITKALADQLHAALATLTPAPLDLERVVVLSARPGIYVLFRNGERVYVGKASKSLKARLSHHLRKLSGRLGIAGEISFVCLYVDEDLEASAPEKLLIKNYRSENQVPWNTNGFGNKDPGKNRDTSLVKENHFDALFPINLDFEVTLSGPLPEITNAFDCLNALKQELPYLLRFDKSRKGILETTQVSIPQGAQPLRAWLTSIIEALPPGWQATALPGYVIVYEEPDVPSRHPSARTVWRKDKQGITREVRGPAQKAPAEKIAGDGYDDDDDESSDA